MTVPSVEGKIQPQIITQPCFNDIQAVILNFCFPALLTTLTWTP